MKNDSNCLNIDIVMSWCWVRDMLGDVMFIISFDTNDYLLH